MNRPFLVFALAGAAACGSLPKTLGEACEDVSEATCTSIRRCIEDDVPSQDECIDAIVEGCCGEDGTCRDPTDWEDPKPTSGEWSACLEQIEAFSCSDWEDDDPVLPRECYFY